jgi:benzoate/toluate 1,2-dioxygenase beta subunit
MTVAARPAADPALIADVSAFLVHEADLLDRWRLSEWLDLYTEDCVYWLPISPSQVSGHDTVSLIFDDRRLLETRVRRTNHALFHAQKPPSRIVHVVGNVRLAAEQPGEGVMVLSNQIATEFRNERMRTLCGVCCHHLVRGPDGGWRIRMKRLDLVDADAVHDGISIIV